MSRKQVMLAFAEEHEENAQRVAAILAGSKPKKVDGHIVVTVSLTRLEDALLLQEAST